MYLVILSKFGDPLLTLNTNKALAIPEAMDLIWRLQTTWGHSVGVLSKHKHLSELPRFANGDLKQESVPKQLRGGELLNFVHSLTKIQVKKPPQEKRAPAWTATTAPRGRPPLFTPEQVDKVRHLLSSGLTIKEVTAATGIPRSSVHRLGASSPMPGKKVKELGTV